MLIVFHSIYLAKTKVPKMTSLSQSQRDRILWILGNNGGKMERSRLRARTGMRYALLKPILEELAMMTKIVDKGSRLTIIISR